MGGDEAGNISAVLRPGRVLEGGGTGLGGTGLGGVDGVLRGWW